MSTSNVPRAHHEARCTAKLVLKLATHLPHVCIATHGARSWRWDTCPAFRRKYMNHSLAGARPHGWNSAYTETERGVWPQSFISGYTSLIPKGQDPPEHSANLLPITVLSSLYRICGRLRAQDLSKKWQESSAPSGMWGGRVNRGAEPSFLRSCSRIGDVSPKWVYCWSKLRCSQSLRSDSSRASRWHFAAHGPTTVCVCSHIYICCAMQPDATN